MNDFDRTAARTLAFAMMVQEFQQSVNAAGGISCWDTWKNRTLEEAFAVLCTNHISVRYTGPDYHYRRLNTEDLYPNQ